MKNHFTTLIILMAIALSTTGQENNNSSFDPSCDIVSGYLWRGIPSYSVLGEGDILLGPNLQPMVTLSSGNIKIGAWGSTDFSGKYKETDLFAGFEIGNVAFELWDYFWPSGWESINYFDYKNKSTGHVFEGVLIYTPSKLPLKLTVATMFFGADKDFNDPDKNAYSTYFEAAYIFNLYENEINLTAGFSPWDGIYGDGYGNNENFSVVNLMATARRNIKITDSFQLPAWGSLIVNPQQNKMYLVFGISL